ncbi:peptidase inhibitor 16 [Trichonephila clavata]|uniref:Peptidase inhibitor 16 n=1 Tax=Trichonephila clavata TaxID=2740835 RepID=A0A8X6GC41_TRICU|nr:peptidase inhibitor 16 [Trichonephila clavata]
MMWYGYGESIYTLESISSFNRESELGLPFLCHFSIIGTLKISQCSNNLTVGKESEGDFNKKSQNSEYHEERPVHSNRILGSNAIVGDKMLIKSYSSIRNTSKEKGLSHQLSKREYPKRGFTEELKQEILDLHNLYRGNVTPSAANMAFMEWDEELEHLAQMWADYCKFEHGSPPGSRYSRGVYGQNLYEGSEPSGSKATYLWYEEYKYYDMKTQYCKPKEMCGHYVQKIAPLRNFIACTQKQQHTTYVTDNEAFLLSFLSVLY